MKEQINSGRLYFLGTSAAVCMLQPDLCELNSASLSVVKEFKDQQRPDKNERCDYPESSPGALRLDPVAMPSF